MHVCRFLVVQRVLLSVLSVCITTLASHPIAQHALCAALLVLFACILLFTKCCSIVPFSNSRAVVVLIAAWSLVVNIGIFSGGSYDYATVFLAGAAGIIAIAVCATVFMVQRDKQRTTLARESSDSMLTGPRNARPSVAQWHDMPIGMISINSRHSMQDRIKNPLHASHRQLVVMNMKSEAGTGMDAKQSPTRQVQLVL